MQPSLLLVSLLVPFFQSLFAAAYPAPSHTKFATVNLRVEGSLRTIFEGPIRTNGHNVTTVSGGTHHCDGTNHNENTTPGPTCTTALDDASIKAHFTWDGYVFL